MPTIVTMLRCICLSGGAFISAAFAPSPARSYGCQKVNRQSRCRAVESSSWDQYTRVSIPTSSIRLFAAPDSKQLARQLYEENLMTPIDDDCSNNSSHHNYNTYNLGGYDEDATTPLESEFRSLMATFLTYSERDIRSLTSTSSHYLDFAQLPDKHSVHKAHKRTKETGIRYRALFEGVQSGARKPAVLRSFSVLFEDYLPIRLAGRRIYNYLGKVIEEIRLERQGEIARAKQICIGWDLNAGEEHDVIEYAHDVWDMLIDESLLLEESLNSGDDKDKPQEVGVMSLSQLAHLGVDKVLFEMNLSKDNYEFQTMFENAIMDEERNMGATKTNTEYLEITFVSFVRMLNSLLSNQAQTAEQSVQLSMIDLLERLERHVIELRQGSETEGGTSTLLAAKAINSGSNNSCKKRQRNSDRFDQYVSTFKIWEDKFVGGPRSEHPSRRLDILRGCFSGARDERVVAALKIVYMDYAALRLAGDLIFKLMSKIAG